MLTAHVHSGPVGHRHIQPGHIGRQSLTRCGDIHSAQGATFSASFLISKINWTQTVHSTNARAYTSFRVPIKTGRTGSSNWPWLITQSGPTSSGITGNSGAPANNLSKENPPFLASGSLPRPTPFRNIWRGGPPSRRTNRPTWQVPGT